MNITDTQILTWHKHVKNGEIYPSEDTLLQLYTTSRASAFGYYTRCEAPLDASCEYTIPPKEVFQDPRGNELDIIAWAYVRKPMF